MRECVRCLCHDARVCMCVCGYVCLYGHVLMCVCACAYMHLCCAHTCKLGCVLYAYYTCKTIYVTYDGYILAQRRVENTGGRGPQGSVLAAASSALRRLHSLQLFLM